jgi:hypothetical protein
MRTVCGMRRRPTSRTILHATLLACLLALAAGCSAPRFVAQQAVSLSQAELVVRDFWPAHEEATADRDGLRLERLETGLALEADAARAIAEQALGTPAPAAPRPLRGVTVYVPRQSRYPLGFIARVDTVALDAAGHPTSKPAALYYHFDRVAADAGWLADFAALGNSAHPVRFMLDGDGYAAVLSIDATGYLRTPRAISGELADYITSGLAVGTPSGPFAPGDHTSGVVSSLRATYDQLSDQGYDPSGDLATRPFTRAYRGAGGSAIVLLAVQATSRIRPLEREHTCLLQPADHLERWGGLVPAGQYDELDFQDLLELVAIDPAAGRGGRVAVIAGGDDRVAVRVTPSANSTCA